MVLNIDQFEEIMDQKQIGQTVKDIEKIVDKQLIDFAKMDKQKQKEGYDARDATIIKLPEYHFVSDGVKTTFEPTQIGEMLDNFSEENAEDIRAAVVADYEDAGWSCGWDNELVNYNRYKQKKVRHVFEDRTTDNKSTFILRITTSMLDLDPIQVED